MTLRIYKSRDYAPVGDRVLIRLVADERTSSGGIILTKSRDVDSQDALVIETGWDAYKQLGSGKAWCRAGDTIRVKKYSGDDIDDIERGYVYRTISDDDVLGIYRDAYQELEIIVGDKDNE